MSIKFDSEVINAWQAVRNDKESANWILVGLSDSEKDTAISSLKLFLTFNEKDIGWFWDWRFK